LRRRAGIGCEAWGREEAESGWRGKGWSGNEGALYTGHARVWRTRRWAISASQSQLPAGCSVPIFSPDALGIPNGVMTSRYHPETHHPKILQSPDPQRFWFTLDPNPIKTELQRSPRAKRCRTNFCFTRISRSPSQRSGLCAVRGASALVPRYHHQTRNPRRADADFQPYHPSLSLSLRQWRTEAYTPWRSQTGCLTSSRMRTWLHCPIKPQG